MEKTYDLDTLSQSMPDFNIRNNYFSGSTCSYKISALYRLNIYKNQYYNKLFF